MKLRYKITGGLLVFMVLTSVSLALVLSYDSACTTPAPLADGVQRMKAIVYRCYGAPDVLHLEDVAKPVPGDGELLVKVHAAAVNPLDWHYMRGTPYLMRLVSGIGKPGDPRMGVDFAGVVEAVGNKVQLFKPGDEVFGARNGAFAEYLTVPEDRAVVLKPANISFADAAAVPVAAVTALQALRDKGKLARGQTVLVNGASGGVGTFAVQIAKALGAEVSGVCSTRNVAMVKSLGADRVFDYRKEDYTMSGQRFDLIIDNVGNHTLLENRRSMNPGGRLVMVGGSTDDWLGPLLQPLEAMLLSLFVEENFLPFLAHMKGDDLAFLAGLLESGEMMPHIDRSWSLSEVAEAIRYSEEGHARGKIIVRLD